MSDLLVGHIGNDFGPAGTAAGGTHKVFVKGPGVYQYQLGTVPVGFTTELEALVDTNGYKLMGYTHTDAGVHASVRRKRTHPDVPVALPYTYSTDEELKARHDRIMARLISSDSFTAGPPQDEPHVENDAAYASMVMDMADALIKQNPKNERRLRYSPSTTELHVLPGKNVNINLRVLYDEFIDIQAKAGSKLPPLPFVTRQQDGSVIVKARGKNGSVLLGVDDYVIESERGLAKLSLSAPNADIDKLFA